jgi:hypothetical protein
MASFDININSKPVLPYTPNFITLTRSNCTALNQSIPLGMARTQENPGIEFLLYTYNTGIAAPWKTLHIRNLSYTNGTNFYLEYNGIKLVPLGDPLADVIAIDVTGVAIDAIIPLFTLELDNIVNTSQTMSMNFSFAITDTNDVQYPATISSATLTINECPPLTQTKPFTLDSTQDFNCFSSAGVTVKVPSEETRHVKIVSSDSFSNFFPSFQETISADKLYFLQIDADKTTGTGTRSTIRIEIRYNSGSANLLGSYTLERRHSGNIC